MKHRTPSQTEKLYKDIDTLVDKLGNIAVRGQDIKNAKLIIQYLQAELRYLKIRSDSAKQEERIRNLRSMIGLNMRKYRGE